jgi:hypothetical protein
VGVEGEVGVKIAVGAETITEGVGVSACPPSQTGRRVTASSWQAEKIMINSKKMNSLV